MEIETGQPRTSEYAKFRILVDDPADDPALGFADYADACAEIVTLSPPPFATGIFGSQGSGKTTLMRAINLIDIVAGALLAASPWLFGFADDGANFWLPFVVIGVAAIGLGLTTKQQGGYSDHTSRPAAG